MSGIAQFGLVIAGRPVVTDFRCVSHCCLCVHLYVCLHL